MNKLLAIYNCKDATDYYSLISYYFRIDAKQIAKGLFLKMPKRYQIEMTKETLFNWHTIEKNERMFYFNLLTKLST